jgi:hypothetical protein
VVVEYRGFRHEAVAAARREHPSALVPLIIDFAEGWSVSSPGDAHRPRRRRGFIAGMPTGRA